MPFEFVRTSVVNRVGWMEYNRPPINAFPRQMVDETHDAMAELIASPETSVVVVASAVEKYFSSGADLDAFANSDLPAMKSWMEKCHQIVALLRNSPKPLLAAIRGVAVGGGMEITLHCDVRFASTDSRFGQPEININFIPPIGATQALARLLGRPRAIRYLYEGTLVNAEEALAMGMVDMLTEPDKLREEVQAYGEMLASKPAGALEAIRKTITLGGALEMEAGLAFEQEWIKKLAAQPDFKEGVTAFMEKRKPKWAGE